MQELATEDILGYPVVQCSQQDCVDRIVDWIENHDSTKYFVCLNPHSVQVSIGDRRFQLALQNADMGTPDGVGIVLASKILGGKIKARVTGSDIFSGLSSRLNEKMMGKYFFLGSTEAVLGRIRSKMKVLFPSIEVVGTYSPPFRPEFTDAENKKIVKAINDAKPDVLWVGMTAPKQEKWIYENKAQLNVKFIGPIGAVFDFFVGNIKRSHPLFIALGLEWLPRLIQEPKRLWRRNFVSNPMFLLRVIRVRVLEIVALSRH